MWIPPVDWMDGSRENTNFLIALWRELFDPFTPDSFQPRIHNVPSLVDELCAVSSRLLEDSVWSKHIGPIAEELESAIGESSAILSALPEYEWQLKRISQCRNDAKKLYHVAALASERRDEYRQRVVSLSESVVEDLEDNKKSRAYAAVRGLGTLAIQLAKEDDDVLEDVDGSIGEPRELMTLLVKNALRTDQEYECVFAIVGRQSQIQRIADRSGFCLCRRTRLPKEYVNSLTTVYDEVHFVTKTTNASSKRDAISRARSPLNTAVDILTLYNNGATVQIHDDVLVSARPGQLYSTVSQAEQAFRRLHPRTNAMRDTKDTLSMTSGHQLEDRLLNALELNSLGVQSADPRVKLVNLWSALECLSGCFEHNAIISRVRALVTPLLVWRRVDKVVRYTAIAVQQLAAHTKNSEFGSGFKRSNDRFVHPWDMMCTLCRPDNDSDVLSLLRFVQGHPLLRYRIYRLWETFHDPLSLRKDLLRSQRRVEWQLNRVYRARNLIVHHGEDIPMLGGLIDNLQYYVSVALQRIIHGLKMGTNWDVRTSAEYWSSKCHYILDTLGDSPSRLRVSDFFPMGSQQPAPTLWC